MGRDVRRGRTAVRTSTVGGRSLERRLDHPLRMCLALGPTPARGERDLALVGATIHPAPGASVIANGIVIVRDGVIAAVGTQADMSAPADADVLDCSGLSLTAGFWNSHVHFMPWRLALAGWLPSFVSAGEIRAMLTRYGFVHVLDTGSQAGQFPRPKA